MTASGKGDARVRSVNARAKGGRERGVALALVIGAFVALFLTATPAQAAEPPTQATHLADHLRENPVYVTDQLPRAVPRSTAPAFARLAERTGVPTYVLVLPSRSGTEGRELLGAVHDRLGRDGLYVLLDESTVSVAAAYGVRAPAEDATTVVLYEVPYDAGPVRSFERFVEVVAQGGTKAAERAEAARERYQDDEPAEMYIGPADRRNQSFLTGILLCGVPVLIVLTVPCVRRWRRALLPGDRKRDTRRTARWIAPGVAAAAAVAIAVTAPLVFDQTKSSAAPPPTPADMSARVERVAAGLEQDPVYADPESPRVLDARQLARLHDRIRSFAASDGGGPVFVSVAPQLPESESAGDPDLFAAAVHAELGKDGVYVVADPDDGTIEVFNHGLRLDSNHLFLDLPDSISLGDDKADEADDHLMGERLDALMTFLDKTPRTDRPGSEPEPAAAPSPAAENTLPPLFSGDFWPGLFVGAFAALLLLGLVAGALALAGSVLRRRPRPLPTELLPVAAPTEPSVTYLRRTAYAELGALAREFAGADDNARAWDRFDAAMLLADGDLDRVRAPGLDPPALVAVIVLARAGRAALTGDGNDLCCGVNPLHGPAVTRHHVRVSTEGQRRRLLPVCEACQDAAIAEPRTVPARLLRLPDPALGNTRVPYDMTDGLLSAVPHGIARLVDEVRETTGVH